MRIVLLSNDVIPGFGVPVAAPGLRAAGLAEGLRGHGHHVTVIVPEDLLHQLFEVTPPAPPSGTRVVSPLNFMDVIDEIAPSVVVFINSNLTPHLQPRDGIHYVYDLFAPKVLELQASHSASPADVEQQILQLSQVKARALGLASSLWVNGSRKVDYAAEWLDRDDVARHRDEFGTGPIDIDAITVVDMAVPLPDGIDIAPASRHDSPELEPTASRRLGIAGYAQLWSTLDDVHPGHQRLVDAGHELHALLPGHWGGNPDSVPVCALPESTVRHQGPLTFAEFSKWVQTMDAMVDVFAPTAERRFAMITRSAVALRLGIPLIHAVDSEISDIVIEHDAGWVLDPDDPDHWHAVISELADPERLAAKSAGARDASLRRFAPVAALRDASDALAR